jgi:hypothetical protein
MAEERWFEEHERHDLSRPTAGRAIEALDAGDVAEARELCEEMKYEWRYLHDLMADGMLSLISFVQERSHQPTRRQPHPRRSILGDDFS